MPGPPDIIAPPPGGPPIPGFPCIPEPASASIGADIPDAAGAAGGDEPPADALDVPAAVDASSSLPPQPISAAAQQMTIPKKWHRTVEQNGSDRLILMTPPTS